MQISLTHQYLGESTVAEISEKERTLSCRLNTPELGVDLGIAEVDIMALLTVKLLEGQGGEGCQSIHKHHLKQKKQFKAQSKNQ